MMTWKCKPLELRTRIFSRLCYTFGRPEMGSCTEVIWNLFIEEVSCGVEPLDLAPLLEDPMSLRSATSATILLHSFFLSSFVSLLHTLVCLVMLIIWVSYAHHIGITCKQHGYHKYHKFLPVYSCYKASTLDNMSCNVHPVHPQLRMHYPLPHKTYTNYPIHDHFHDEMSLLHWVQTVF